ncbi:hypothetical protein CDL15_Pgr020922 [Punica granatum]|uniref:Protein kinase domain-containing protein n=1 Tax=Punica granatum TaxID=22663 RepID=A0A218XVZ1_PUNGR|nr:hypothetical protein CDL15_Pgr020922 [Punica granatum]
MLNLAVSALEGDFDEEDRNTWNREDFERNEITDVPLMTGSLQVTLKDGIGALGAFYFNYSSEIAKSGKFKLGVKTLTGECGGICVREGTSNAFVVKDVNVTSGHDAAACQMHLSEDSQVVVPMTQIPCHESATANSNVDFPSWFGPVWSPGMECKPKQKHNVKSGQVAIRWPKLKAISRWTNLKRAFMEKRAQKILRRARVQKRLEECNKGDQDCSLEDHRRLQVKEKLKENPEKDVMLTAPSQVATCPEEYSKGKSGSALDEEAAKPLVLEVCPPTVVSFSCAGDSIPRKQDSSQWRNLFTLFPSLLSGDDTDLGEDKAREFLKHTARQSTSPTKDNELVGMSNLSMCTSNYYSNTTGFSTTSSNAQFLKAVVAGDAEPDGRILIPNLKLFTFSELKSAARNFGPDFLLGEGGFGKVYKGWVDEKTLAPSRRDSGIPVAVKKLNPESIEGFNEWQAEMKFVEAEMKFVGTLLHPNIVRLLGYCWKDNELFLVSEFTQKGSLDNHLFRRNPSIQPLSWEKRLKIAIGAARGLAFLHGSEKQVIFRDFKTSNIFLDSDYNAKIAYFGLARLGTSGGESHVMTRVMGTYGYAAPEYLATGHLSTKSDVYGFGVVLLELLTGRQALDMMQRSGQHLVEWARPFLNEGKKLKIIIDPWIEGQFSFKAILQTAELTQKCLAKEPRDRPSMKEVVKALERTEAMTELPKEKKVRSASHP